MIPPPEPYEQLRKLLALKRHEMPPPGYFATFSSKVIARIEAEGLSVELPWWRRVLAGMTLRPVALVSYSAVVLGVFALAASASRYLEDDQNVSVAVANPWASGSLLQGNDTPAPVSIAALDPVDATSSVKPVLAASPGHALFDVNRLAVQRVSYRPR
jgi:hypothetical protein